LIDPSPRGGEPREPETKSIVPVQRKIHWIPINFAMRASRNASRGARMTRNRLDQFAVTFPAGCNRRWAGNPPRLAGQPATARRAEISRISGTAGRED
jgi:hypothetical protein